MSHNLINRDSEREFLNSAFKQKKAQLVVVYGRRRVGKSHLTLHFVNEKGGIYYLCSKGNEKEQLELLSNKFADHFRDSSLISRPFTKWHDFFIYLAQKAKENAVVLEFDEFPFLIAANPAITSIFQKYWDEYLSKSKIYIILCGSSIGMMESEVLGYKSPLYGRRTGQWKLGSLQFKHVLEFFKSKVSLQHIVEIYAITGGMPFYLVTLDLDKSAIENIMLNIAKKGKPLLDEGEALVREELPEAMTYFSILHAIAHGEAKQNDIANHVGMPATALVRYLTNLQRLGFIQKSIPITEKQRSKKSLYFIADSFLNFWFKFIYPNKSYIEEEDYDKLEYALKRDFNIHVSGVFEDVCRQLMEELRKRNEIDFDMLGSWWGAYRDEETNERKTQEIDIVAMNGLKKEICFGECKWQEKVSAPAVLKALQEKAKLVKWHDGNRAERYILFAKSFKDRKNLSANVSLFDLADMEKIFGRH